MTMPATPHQKFTFDTEFFEVVGGGARPITAPVVGPQAPLPRGPEAVRQQAYAEGHAAGLVEGHEQAQTDLARMQQHLQQTLHSLQEATTAREEQIISLMLGLLQGTLIGLIGNAASHYGPEVLEHHLRQLLPLAKTDEALTLRIHPSARGYHEKLGLPHANILGLPLRIVPDGTLGPVDALMEWGKGGVEARLADHTKALQELLASAGATPLPQPDFTSPTTVVIPAQAGTAASPAPATPAVTPAKAGAAQVGTNDPLAQVAQERASRAAALLGDDELVDALK